MVKSGHASSPFQACGIIQTLLEFFVLFDWPLALGIQQSIAPEPEFDGENTNVVEQHWHDWVSIALYLTLSFNLIESVPCGSLNDHSPVHLFCLITALGSSITVKLYPRIPLLSVQVLPALFIVLLRDFVILSIQGGQSCGSNGIQTFLQRGAET